MENIKAAVTAVCAVSAVRCVIGTIVSASRLKKQVTLLMDLLLALTMITPFAQGFSEFDMPELKEHFFTEYDMSGDAYAEAIAAETEKNIKAVIEEQLDAFGINYSNVEINVNILPDYSISISSVTVTSEEPEAAALIIKKCLGNETEVINGSV